MNLTGNTIFITGGATGIGRALAAALLAQGNTVVVCGRRAELLAEAQAALPGLHTRVADLRTEAARVALAQWITREFPKLNIVINNAGIQRELAVAAPDAATRFAYENEIETNLTAPIHLTLLLLPHLLQQQTAAVMNISSGLGYVPLAIMPVYCATKAALQSFTRSLRYQLKKTTVRVFDLAPPIVDTDLDQGARAARGQKSRGISAEKVAEAALSAFRHNRYDVAVMPAAILRVVARLMPNRIFAIFNRRISGQ